ncbi:MAG: hypothetical protein Q9185_002368 [Variospora sp. 1 TL-2023]
MASNDQQTIEQLRKELNRLRRDYARLESDHTASLSRIESDRRKFESDRRRLVGDLEDAQADQDCLQEKYQSLSKELTDANQEISDLKSNLDAFRLAASAVPGPSDLTKPLQTVARQQDAALVEVDSLKIQLNEQLSEIQALKKLTESHAELETGYEDAKNEVDQLRKLVSRMDLQTREPPRTPTESIPSVPSFQPMTALPSEMERAFQATADTCKQGDAQPKAKSRVKGQPQAEPNPDGGQLKKAPFQDQRPASQTSVKSKGKDPEARQIKPKAPELKPDTVQKPPAVEPAHMEDLPSRSAGSLKCSTYATAAQTEPRDIFSFYENICKPRARDPPSTNFFAYLPPSAIRVLPPGHGRLPKPNTTAVKSKSDALSFFEDIRKARAMAPPKTGLFSKSLQSSIQPLLPDLDGLPNPFTTAVKSQPPSPNTSVSSPARSQLGQPLQSAATTAQYKPVHSKGSAAPSQPTHAKPTAASPVLSKSTQSKGSKGQFGSTQPGATRAKTSASSLVQSKPRQSEPSATSTGQAGSSQAQGSGMPSYEDWSSDRSSLEPIESSPWYRPTGLNVVAPGTSRVEKHTISTNYSGGVITGLELSSSNSGLQTAGAQQVGKAPVWSGSSSNIRDELPLGTESQELTPRTELRPTGVSQLCTGRSSTPPAFEQTHSIKALAMKDDESKGKKRFITESDTSDTDKPPSKIPRL